VGSENHVSGFFLVRVSFELNQSAWIVLFEVVLEIVGQVYFQVPKVQSSKSYFYQHVLDFFKLLLKWVFLSFHHINEVVDAVDRLKIFFIEVLFDVFDLAYFIFIKVLSQVFFVAFFDDFLRLQGTKFT
jgi:hypothetical protein